MTSSDTLKSAVSRRKFADIIAEARYSPKNCRDKRFWKLATDTLEQMYEGKEIFMRGLIGVIVSEYEDAKASRAPPTSEDAGIRTEDSL